MPQYEYFCHACKEAFSKVLICSFPTTRKRVLGAVPMLLRRARDWMTPFMRSPRVVLERLCTGFRDYRVRFHAQRWHVTFPHPENVAVFSATISSKYATFRWGALAIRSNRSRKFF